MHVLKAPVVNTKQVVSECDFRMVKNGRDLGKTPRRRSSLSTTRSVPRGITAPKRPCGNIRVVVRVRPPNEKEQGDNSSIIIKAVDETTLIFDPKEDDEPFFYHGVQQRNRDMMKRAKKNLHFTFDKVFSYEANNIEVFHGSTKELIQSLMNGYNCSVFVYGATGAGKTHTMLGSGYDPGITSLTVDELFRQKTELAAERRFEIAMSYLEVYNETVQDLLNPGTALQLREDAKYGVIVSGIQVHKIDTPEKLFELLEKGNRRRTQHPTDANAESSRSHAVFQVYIHMKFTASSKVWTAKLSMIDLAGSERGAATGFSGARFTEGANINRSLLSLGNCINSLADGQRHVPYRDSKLTRLLKDSLGGNCRTVMIANVSPSSLSYEDTYNTLKYATRAKKIKSIIKKNVVNCETNINHYIKLVDELTKEVERLKFDLSLATQQICQCKKPMPNETPESSLSQLQTELLTVSEEKKRLEERLHELESSLQANIATKQLKGTELTISQHQAKLLALYEDKKRLEQRAHQLESTLHLTVVRKQLKETSNSRLSAICDTPDKEEGHRKLGGGVERLEHSISSVQKEFNFVQESIKAIDAKIQLALQENHDLETVSAKEEHEVNLLRIKCKLEHQKKLNDLQSGELRMQDQLIEQLASVLKPCYLQLRGHGYAPDSLIASYQNLVRHVQGFRTVTWDLDTDSGMSCNTDSEDVESVQSLKEPSLNTTFVLDNKNAFSAEKFLVKVYAEKVEMLDVLNRTQIISQKKLTPPRSKACKPNLAKKCFKTKASPRDQSKENRAPFHARPMPNFNNFRAVSAQDKNKVAKLQTDIN